MPKLWNETIEAHRHAVREAILEQTWALVTEQGLASVTMTQIAERVGIGRATLYGYFPDVQAILLARHDQQVADHIEHLTGLRVRAPGDRQRLDAVLEAYALICHHRQHHELDLVALLHRGERMAPAQQQLVELVQELVTVAVAAGEVRDDIPPDELASYCVHTLTTAGSMPSEAAVRRLLTLVRAGLRPPR